MNNEERNEDENKKVENDFESNVMNKNSRKAKWVLWTTVDVTQNGGRTMNDGGGVSSEGAAHLEHDRVINSSPITSFHPIVHVTVGCQNEIQIPGIYNYITYLGIAISLF